MGHTNRINIKVAEGEERDILIASLSEFLINGFEENDELLSCFIGDESFDKRNVLAVLDAMSVSYDITTIAEKNWNETWESSFEPIRFDDFIYVRASFHQSVQGFEHELIITPKMSFGSGHHPTTSLCIEMMRGVDFNGKQVIDFGAGTGILSILAEKLGAIQITAIDNDIWSINNIEENILLNNCNKILIEENSFIKETFSADIILANLNRHILIEHFSSIKQSLTKGGILILSGILGTDVEEFNQLAKSFNLSILSVKQNGDWAGILLENKIQAC